MVLTHRPCSKASGRLGSLLVPTTSVMKSRSGLTRTGYRYCKLPHLGMIFLSMPGPYCCDARLHFNERPSQQLTDFRLVDQVGTGFGGHVFERSFLIIRPPKARSAADTEVSTLDKEFSQCLFVENSASSYCQVPHVFGEDRRRYRSWI